MKKATTASHLWRAGKRSIAVAVIGLMVGILAVPQTSLASTLHHPRAIAHVVQPGDDGGSGDSPVMP